MTLQDLLDRSRQLTNHRAQLVKALDRVRATEADANTWLHSLIERDEIFGLHPKEHIDKVRADRIREWKQQRKQAAGVALFHVEQEQRALAPDVRDFRQQAMRAPDAVASYLTRSGGQRINLSDETELLIQLLDEQRRARFRDEMAGWSPLQVRDAYARAGAEDSDEALSLARYIEGRFANGWTGPTLGTDDEIKAAQDLRKLIVTVQAARVPAELAEVEQTVEDARVLVGRASNRDLYDLRPVNPEHEPAAAVAYESELEALTEGAAQ